jgi:AcrR family transcriptional regulator
MTRLTKSDWLDQGLRVLAHSGPDALKAEPLAKSLNVSRGSFYWHFRDLEAFHEALLARWKERATADIIARIERAPSHSARLRLLMQIGMAGDNALERNMRSWATQSNAAADAVASIDEARTKYMSRLLREAGVPRQKARARAIFLYWAYAGRVMVSQGQRSLSDQELDAIAALLQSE